MNFKTILYKILISALIFSFITGFFKVFTLPTDPTYLAAVYLVYSICIVMHEKLLAFLTVRKVFLTRIVAITALSLGILVLFELFVPGFKAGELSLQELSLGILVVKSNTLDKYVTIALVSFVAAFLYALLEQLEGRDDYY